MHAKAMKILVFFWFLFVSCEEVLSLTLTSLPSVLFSGGSWNILEGSVVWLYCLADPISPNLTITWTKDSEPLVQDVPHIRLKNTGSNISMYSTFILVLDKFQASDSGEYQCIAQDDDIISLGDTTRLLANASGRVNGQIEVITGDIFTTLPFPYTNRIGYTIGRVIFHQYVVGHVGDSSTAYQTPSVLWLKDGIPLRIAPMNTPGTNGRLTTSILFTFAESDAGVYQVVFNDTTRSEVFVTDPIRLDTGEILSIKAVSPPITILRLPEKLVLEVTATGRYDAIQWMRNGHVFQSTGFNTEPENFVNFFEIYFNEPTTVADLGVYEVESLPTGGSGQIADRIVLFVTQPVAVLTVSSGADAPVYEGDNMTISCTLTGVPIPTITWEFVNNQSISHLRSDVYTDYGVNYDSGEVTPGNVVSTLHIVNAQYPADAGEYMCTGSNSHNGLTANSSAMITVRFLGLLPLVVTSFPELLFNGRTQTLVEGSVVWLYCEVNSMAPSLTVTWNKDGNSLVQDVPHIIIERTSASMFILIVNDLQTTDSGEYQCSALDEYSGDTGMGMVLTLAVSAITTDTLRAFSSEVDVDPLTQLYFANRAAYSSGDTATISCDAGYLSQSSFITTPEVTWLKDGIPIIHTPNSTLDSSNLLTTNISFTFTESDAGVYQCFFTDTTRSELVVDDPIQIDTGALSIEAVSPMTIIFRPPDKLVIETRAAGEYYLVEWNINGNRIRSDNVLNLFSHFTEIFFIEPTTMATAGVYEVLAQTKSGVGVPDPLQFAVINFVDANISVSSEPGIITVSEMGSVDISCTSTGVPVPTITWTVRNQLSPFTQTDISTDYSVIITGASATLETTVTSGNVVSTLHIVNPQYPTHNGGYTCIGSNTNGVSTISNSATVSVYIPVIPEVDVTAVRSTVVAVGDDVTAVRSTVVAVGDDVTLTCNVIRGNPVSYTYTWIHVNTSTTLTGTTHTLHLSSIGKDELGTYMCEVTNLAGVGMGTIELGIDPQTSISPQLLVGIEGNNVSISCNSTGVPVPTITWTVNDQPGTSLGEESFQINEEIVFSSLVIVNVQYSTGDNAVCTCTGSNTHGEDSVSIILQVLVPPEIEVRTDRTPVGLLDDVTLTCVVNRAVPMPDNYTWIHVDTNTILMDESNSSTYTFTPFKDEIGTYRCEVITVAGYGMDTITIEPEDVLAVISLPEVLFSRTSQNILEGSVVWLYCLTVPKSPTVTVTWSRDGEPLVQDVPHIRLRSTGSDADMYSTFLLVVEPVDITDGGVYQCSAQEGENIAMGPALTITVDAGGGNGATQIIRSDNITNFESHQSGDEINLDYIIGHVGDDNISYQIPSVLWLKDGLPFRIAPTNTPDPRANGRLTTELIFTFTESDGGVYQLVSTADINGRLTMFLAHPIRLNTGETLDVQPVSPTNIILRPTERLVLEVRASGQYRSIEWEKNGVSFFSSILPDNENFAHFVEVYYNEFIGISDFGVYYVALSSVNLTQVQPVGVQFTVIQYHDANTSVSSGADAVHIDEGESVNISCISTGIPVPTITWTFSNQTTPFTQMDIYTDINVTVTGASTVAVTQGNVVSILHIVNLQYPSNTGDYVCSGSNNMAGTTSSSAIIIVDTAPLDVEVTADHTRVVLGDDVTLICALSSGISINYTYSWTYVNIYNLTAEISRSHTLSLPRISMDQLGTYRCEVRSEIGTGIDAISIRLGDAPDVTARVSPPSPVIKGSIVNLVCDVIAGDFPISYSWASSSGEGLSSDSKSGNISVPFCAREDYGIYTCTATNPFGFDTSQVEVLQAVLPAEFVLCLSGVVPDCIEWISVNSGGKINDLEQEILNAMNLWCQCNVKRDQITASQFACSSQSSDSVNFFSTINGTSQVPTSELLGYLESWVVASSAMITVQSQQLGMDVGNCDSTATTTETPISVGRQSSGISAIVLYVVVAVQFSVIIILVMVIAATLLVRKIRVKENIVSIPST